MARTLMMVMMAAIFMVVMADMVAVDDGKEIKMYERVEAPDAATCFHYGGKYFDPQKKQCYIEVKR